MRTVGAPDAARGAFCAATQVFDSLTFSRNHRDLLPLGFRKLAVWCAGPPLTNSRIVPPFGSCKFAHCRVRRPDMRIRKPLERPAPSPGAAFLAVISTRPEGNSHFSSLLCDYSLRSALPLAIVRCGPRFFGE